MQVETKTWTAEFTPGGSTAEVWRNDDSAEGTVRVSWSWSGDALVAELVAELDADDCEELGLLDTYSDHAKEDLEVALAVAADIDEQHVALGLRVGYGLMSLRVGEYHADMQRKSQALCDRDWMDELREARR